MSAPPYVPIPVTIDMPLDMPLPPSMPRPPGIPAHVPLPSIPLFPQQQQQQQVRPRMTIPAIVRPKAAAPVVPDARIEQARKLGWVQLPTPDGQSWTWYHPHSGAHVDMATLDANQVLQAAKEQIVQAADSTPQPKVDVSHSADDLADRIAKKREELQAKQKLTEEAQRQREEELARIEAEKEKERIRLEEEREEENLRRLPPGLRARLMKRGIISEAKPTVKKAESGSEPGTPGDSDDDDPPPPPPGPPPETPLPEGWIKAGTATETYYWNVVTNTTQYERPTEAASKCSAPSSSSGAAVPSAGKKYACEQIVGVVEGDISRLIGKGGSTINILKAALGDCQIQFPKKGGAPTGTALNGKPLYPVKVMHNDPRMAKKGKKAIDIYLGYAKTMEYACSEAGLKLKDDKEEEEAKVEEAPPEPEPEEEKPQPMKKNGKKKGKKRKKTDANEAAEMKEAAAYATAPKANWSRGPEQQRKRLAIG